MIFSLPFFGKFRIEKVRAVSNNIDLPDLHKLRLPVLEEVVREGEDRIKAQNASHLSTDQRGYTIAGLQLTVATTAFAAYFSMVEKNPVPPITIHALILGAGLFFLAFVSFVSVLPKRFGIPGNEPANWLPNNWKYSPYTEKWAKVEQAECLQLHIAFNSEVGRKKAYCQIFSIFMSFVLVFGLALAMIIDRFC